MDLKADALEKLVQIARYGAVGDGEKVRVHTMRLIRSLREQGNPLAARLQDVVFSQRFDEASTAVIRRVKDAGISAPPPTDLDSGGELLNIEDPVVLPEGFMRSREIKGPLDLIVGEFKHVKKLSDFGISPTSKVLFTGPPGVGKTVAARYLASKLKLPLVVLDLASVVSSFLGRTGSNIKKALEYASSRPCVLLLDEIDSIAKKRDDISDVGEIKRLVTVVLQELDLWQSKGVLIAATNHYHLLDPAVQRRFDRVIEFKRPGFDELLEVGGLLIRREEKIPKAWVVFMARIMADTSFSDFQREVNNLRRHYLIEGEAGAEEYLKSQLEVTVKSEDRAFRKELAVLLVNDGRASQRSASRITGVSRDTLRHALTTEV